MNQTGNRWFEKRRSLRECVMFAMLSRCRGLRFTDTLTTDVDFGVTSGLPFTDTQTSQKGTDNGGVMRLHNLLFALSVLLLPLTASSLATRLLLKPLIGGPSFLPIHVAVVVDEDHIWDFIPLEARSEATTRTLLTLKAVPGEVRYKSNGKRKRMTTAATRAQQFARTYPKQLHLIGNNCWTFALLLLWHLYRGDNANN